MSGKTPLTITMKLFINVFVLYPFMLFVTTMGVVCSLLGVCFLDAQKRERSYDV